MLGSAAATTFGLAATLVVFLVLSGETPEFRDELPLLAVYLGIFAVLTALAALSFIGQARQRPWRRWAALGMWGSVVVVAALYAWTRA
jgi:hypothetical protein